MGDEGTVLRDNVDGVIEISEPRKELVLGAAVGKEVLMNRDVRRSLSVGSKA